MKNIIKNIAIFSSGVIIGAFVTKLCMEKIYDKILEKMENESENLPGGENPENNSEIHMDKESNEFRDPEFDEFYTNSQTNYFNIMKDEGYSFNEHTTVVSESGEVMYDEDLPDPPTERYDSNGEELEEYPIMADRPYNIPQEEYEVYCDFDHDWESAEYTYYPDGFVTDDTGLPVTPEDVINVLGTDFPKWFGTYDENQIWIRNDRLRMDFSVIKDSRNFADIADARLKRLAGIR